MKMMRNKYQDREEILANERKMLEWRIGRENPPNERKNNSWQQLD
jgi:hypothetical protein